jgi:hypothetical protein
MTMRTGANPSRISHARGAIKLLKLLNALRKAQAIFTAVSFSGWVLTLEIARVSVESEVECKKVHVGAQAHQS